MRSELTQIVVSPGIENLHGYFKITKAQPNY